MRESEERSVDRWLLGVVMILVVLGALMVYSASSFRGAEKYGDPAQFVKNHLIRVCLGLVLLFVLSRFDYRRYRWITPLLLLMMTMLLVGVLFGPEFQGSRRSFLVFGKQFQPSEFMKLTMILYLAAIFAKGERSPSFQSKTLMVHYVIVLMIIGLIFLEPDLGTSLVLFFLAMTMFYLAGLHWKQLAKMGLFLMPLISLGLLLFPYQRQRVADYLGSVTGSEPMSHQVKQSIIGLANGGLTGVGYASGRQKLFFLPEPFSDFILASLGEEMGFIGVALVFGLLLFLLWRGIRIARHAPDRYGMLLAGGITAMILINALMHAGVVVNLLPTTGLPFPFLSYGGSSLLVQLAGVGILMNISRKTVVSYRRFTMERGRLARWQEED